MFEVWWVEWRNQRYDWETPWVTQQHVVRTEREALLLRAKALHSIGVQVATITIRINMEIGACDGGA